MKPRLSEEPSQWRRFALVLALMISLLAGLFFWRGRIGGLALAAVLGLAIILAGAAAWKPRWFRGLYRAAMTGSFHVGQVVGKVVLTVLFFAVITPLGLMLRLSGKDLLGLRRPREPDSTWQPIRRRRRLDQQF
ncbi:MAG TPA: hypothetical protein P5555_16200 [Candidatus Paceibacterota bacterium]|nr:hypothetical protein [Verrucomicrobiota bacterium]HRZ46723.1 hypothetical protein [Candidatus Paceibacterota bacterium]HRZ92005.1 hypothetical protein [Candidatus Paceibacterota bacterium]